MLGRLEGLAEEAARLGPSLPVALALGLALVEAIILPRRLWAKGAALAAVLLCGAACAVLLSREQRTAQGKLADQRTAAQAAELAALQGVWAQWDALSKTLPAAPQEAAAEFDTVDDALASLSAKVATVGEQIAALKAARAGRAIDPAVAVKLAAFLRQYGGFRAVVSCAPGDIEAYGYANQLVSVLRAAGWDAHGPEATANITDQSSMEIMVLLRDPSAPEAAKILLDAFNQFNIPHQPGISADTSIPDTATVELFVAKKP